MTLFSSLPPNPEQEQHEVTEYLTRRTTVPALEEILYQPLPVLDHGFVRVIDYMGTDSSIVQSARVSYGKGTRRLSEDRGLIRYLIRHHHSSPFEMCELKLHIKLPIFVARQWVRHRTANINEYSGRYSILEKEFYIPEPDAIAAQSLKNHQGRDQLLSDKQAQEIQACFQRISEEAYQAYTWLLGPEAEAHPEKGVARELARVILPINLYTHWYWKIDLHNLMHFLRLRYHSNAQSEIQAYAETILQVMAKWVPITYEAFQDYRIKGVYLSSQAWSLIRKMIFENQRHLPPVEATNLSSREWDELQALIDQS